MAAKRTARPKLEEIEEIEAEVAPADEAAVEVVESAAEPPLTDSPTALALIWKKAESEAAWLAKEFPEGGGGPAADRLRDLIGFLRAQTSSSED